MRRAAAFVVALAAALHPAPAAAQDTEPFAAYAREVVGKAAPEECWYRNPRFAGWYRVNPLEPPFPLNGPDLLGEGCPDRQDLVWSAPGAAGGSWEPVFADPPANTVPVMLPGRPKVDQAYVWGLARAGGALWFGTMANTNCLVQGEYLGLTGAFGSPVSVCEMGGSRFAYDPWNLPRTMGDWRPPRIYRYDPAAGGDPRDVTPVDAGGRLLTDTTLGLRSAGAIGDVVLLAGPALPAMPSPTTFPLPTPYPATPPIPGINVFAFDAATGAFIGWETLPAYVNIRRWVEAGGALYTAVQNAAGGGSVLRWRGLTRPDPEGDPLRIALDLEVVGSVDLDAADLVEHKGRLYVATWPVMDLTAPKLPGIWMSPPLPPGGLDASHAGAWRKVWTSAAYEPDPVVAYTYGGGAMASFNGWLYFSTMHVPYAAVSVFWQLYPLLTGQALTAGDYDAVVAGTWRATSVFRTRGFDAPWPAVELLYGEGRLPAWNGDAPPTWRSAYNGMRTPARYGASGFGNPFNGYLWSLAVHEGQLFAGTMDASSLAALGPVRGLPPFPAAPGADLHRFLPADLPALPESLDGLGNDGNYGVRALLSAPEGLYAGTANPMNIAPGGGWELLRLTRRRGVFPPAGPTGTVFTVSGSGFGGRKGKVSVGGRAAAVLHWTKNLVTCRLPGLPAGTHAVRVVAAAGKVFRYPRAFRVP